MAKPGGAGAKAKDLGHPFAPPSAISVEMRSIRSSVRSGTQSSTASIDTGGYRGQIDSDRDFGIEGGEGGSDNDDAVSDITVITRAVDGVVDPRGTRDGEEEEGDGSRPRRVHAIVPLAAFAACVLAVLLVRGGLGRGDEDDAPAVVETVDPADPGTADRAGGAIVEFRVANLVPAQDARNCTEDPLARGPESDCPLDTTGTFRVLLRPEWAPLGADRFRRLASSGFWDGVRIFRVVPDFVSQFGISPHPAVQRAWDATGPIDDDDVRASNVRGTLSFATSGPNTRSTQVFVNLADNRYLDPQGFAPIGEVLTPGNGHGGMDVVDRFYAGYGEDPDQGRMREEGLGYSEVNFPSLSYFEGARLVEGDDGIFE